MKSERGGKMLSPATLFRVTSGAPPAGLKTVAEFIKWRREEDERMLAECTRCFRQQIDAAFQQLQRDLDGDVQH